MACRWYESDMIRPHPFIRFSCIPQYWFVHEIRNAWDCAYFNDSHFQFVSSHIICSYCLVWIAGIFFIHCTCILITNTNFANLNMICVTLKETINLLIPCRIKKSLFYEHFTGWTTVLCNPLLVAFGQDIWYSAFKDWCHIISLTNPCNVLP